MATIYQLTDPNALVENQFIYADTSFIYELHGSPLSPTRQNECTTFSRAVISKGGLLVCSGKSREELRIMMTAKKTDTNRRKRKLLLQQNPNLTQAILTSVHIIEEILGNPNNGFVFLEDVGNDPSASALLKATDNAMATYGIEYGDAAHYVIAQASGLWDPGQPIHIVTLDQDLLNVPDANLVLHVDSETYVKAQGRGLTPLPTTSVTNAAP